MGWFASLLVALGDLDPPVAVPVEPEPVVVRALPVPVPTVPASDGCIDSPRYEFGGADLAVSIRPSRRLASVDASDFRLEVDVRDPRPGSGGLFPDYDRQPRHRRTSLWAAHVAVVPWYGSRYAVVVTGLTPAAAGALCRWLQHDCDSVGQPYQEHVWVSDPGPGGKPDSLWPRWDRRLPSGSQARPFDGSTGRACVLMTDSEAVLRYVGLSGSRILGGFLLDSHG